MDHPRGPNRASQDATPSPVTGGPDALGSPLDVGGGSILTHTQLIAAATVAVLLLLITWAVPRPTGDLYVAYAGGRDVLEGKLGQLDDWCFNTTHRVWYNQNWGTHLLYHLTYVWFGEGGYLALKLLILGLAGAGMVLAGRQYGTRWPVGLLVAGVALLSAYAFLDLRPNIISLTLAPIMLWLLHRTRDNPHRIWWAVALSALWQSMHGGFVFGIGMIGLWGLCQGVAAMIVEGRTGGPQAISRVLRRLWPFAAAPVAAILMGGILTPFGWENLTHFFVVGREEAWRRVLEWRSVWALTRAEHGDWVLVPYGSTWEFLCILVVFAALLVSRWSLRLPSVKAKVVLAALIWVGAMILCWVIFKDRLGTTRHLNSIFGSREEGNELGANVQLIRFLQLVFGAVGVALLGIWMWKGRPALVFNTIIALMVIYMAFNSRRFIPLALFTTAGMLAWNLDTVLGRLRARWAVIPLAAVMLLPGWRVFSQHGWRFYNPANPLYPANVDSTYKRMIFYGMYAPGAVEFLNANHEQVVDAWREVQRPELEAAARERLALAPGSPLPPPALAAVAADLAQDHRWRTVHEWRWEGYLHWLCPQLHLYVGGRAQQVHPVEDYLFRGEIWDGKRSIEKLDTLNAEMIVLPADGQSQTLLHAVWRDIGSRWVAVYYDSQALVLVDAQRPSSRQWVLRAVRDELQYPKDSRGGDSIRAWSRAMCMSSERSGVPGPQAWQALREAARAWPDPTLYARMTEMAEQGRVPREALLQFLHEEAERLEGLDPADARERLQVLQARDQVALTLHLFYYSIAQSQPRSPQGQRALELAEQWAQRVMQVREAGLKPLLDPWR